MQWSEKVVVGWLRLQLPPTAQDQETWLESWRSRLEYGVRKALAQLRIKVFKPAFVLCSHCVM